MVKTFAEQITRLIQESLKELTGVDHEISPPVRPPEGVDADFAFPCFPLAKLLRKAPVAIADEIARTIGSPEWLEKIEVAGPYLNFSLDKKTLFKSVVTAALDSEKPYGESRAKTGRKILVEYSSPNTNKPLHLGHIRNNVLGMAVINLLRAAGHEVVPASILNNRGIHICKAMVAYLHFGDGRTPEDEGVKGDHFVGSMYVLFDKKQKEDPALMDEAREMLRKWEANDPETLDLWDRLNQWVYQGFDDTYQRLGSKFELVQYESNTYLLGREIVRTGLEKGVFQRKEDGSVWIDLNDVGLDEKAVLRKDGTSLYVTQDLGVAVERFDSMKLDDAIYVVGSEQIYHFKVLFQIFKRLGFQWAENCTHLSYGMVYLPEGKMKSREGKVVDADDLMDEMKQMSLDVMERSHFSIDPDRRHKIAEEIGSGAIKYYILKFNPQKDIHFDPAKSLSFEGATGAYIQYCHARINSVLKKISGDYFRDFNVEHLGTPEEIALIRTLMQYPEIVQTGARELNPSRLAGYLWETAKSFNVFYTRNRIVNDAEPEVTLARAALSAATSKVIASGLTLLGIAPVEEM